MKLIFAQGNPGPQYVNSRHNVGFAIIDSLANKYSAKWDEKSKFNAEIAQVTISGEKALLVKPTSFYNETGLSARQIIDFYKIDKSNDLLVIHDDLDLPFGVVRIRKQGSDAGNNGIKSLNSHLDPDFARIRVGINNDLRQKGDEVSFVLGKFNTDESKQLKDNIIPCVFEIIDEFCAGNIKETSYKI